MLAVPGVAQADNGDADVNHCNVGEICFDYDGNGTYMKQFWNAGTHDGYYFYRISDNAKTNFPLRDDAWGLWNRDTACSVKVIDVLGFAPDQSQTFGKLSTGIRMLADDVRNQNDKHERVNCS